MNLVMEGNYMGPEIEGNNRSMDITRVAITSLDMEGMDKESNYRLLYKYMLWPRSCLGRITELAR